MCEYFVHTMPPIVLAPIVIPWGQHYNLKILDFESDGDPDNLEPLQIGGSPNGLLVKVGNLADNNQVEGPSNQFTEDTAHGRIVRLGATAQNGATGSVNVIAPGTPGPGQSNVIEQPFTTGVMPSQERLESGGATGPFPGV